MNNAVDKREKGIFSILFDLFRSLKLTISIFILLAILSIIGTLITQNAASEEYIRRYGMGLYEVLNFFNLFDMYHSWWFSAVLLLLVVNLLACSLHRLPGIWNQIFRGPGSEGLDNSMLKTLPYAEKVKVLNGASETEEGIRSHLEKRFKKVKRIETESAVTFFSEKGRFSRLGVPISHLSILIVLIGGLLGSLYGFRGHMEILEGETVDQIHLRGTDGEVTIPLRFSVRCDDFNVTFYDLPGKEKHVKAYTSLLTIIDDGKEVLKRTIEVNHPLHYRGLAFYQASYGALHEVAVGLQWKGKKEKTILRILEGDTVPIPDSDAAIRLIKYAPQVHNAGEGAQIVLFKPNREPRPFWVLKNFPQFSQGKDEELIFSFDGVSSREYTGLQVTKDPGVWVVWVGCGLMVLGFIVSFFLSHQKVWVRVPKSSGEVVLAGTANKNRVGFEKTFHQLVEEVRSSEKERSGEREG